ncbi:PLP-dependent aminotransferase family protein [Pseudoclostridium thermosuccinogenes]|uniref:MocR-like pyridoxine biosynthesis transcription factor PdxR n=1 Tax=Clostridium thermosuccinogenes TaxID=84032 RepID=UPI000CCC5A44|nr:PLP-dependent aminotransferase family protein [Pseudoclostridium thermosuccinogenes]PNT91112.1 GntR family transcriptional regulator [Pseudoclostridium thermosuccinogenes]
MLELFSSITIDKDSETPLYIQLYENIKKMIEGNILAPDMKLPSVRQLASSLHVNQITVVSALKLLQKDGFIYTRPGSGTYVEDLMSLPEDKNRDGSSIVADELYLQDDLPMIADGQINVSSKTINFASATPTPDLFPVEDFKAALNEVLDRDKGTAFAYQDSHGYYPLRECVAGMMQKAGINCTPGNVQIISGAQQGIDIISKAFLRQGDSVVTESPTYTGAIAVFRTRGAQIVDVELDEDGPNMDLLEYSLKKFKPKLIYAIPSFHNPTGYTYSESKRKEMLNLAEKYDCYIIEDDYVSDLDFEGKNLLPLKARDKNNRVIFIKSFSKIFMPGLRLGFMIVPQDMRSNILEAKHTTDISTSGLIQRAFDTYIRKGYWDKHFKFMFDIYEERYFKTIKVLDECLPDGVHYTKPGGGLNIWLNMPYGFSVNSLFKQSAANDIAFAPGSIFYSSNSSKRMNSLRLSFASVYTDQIEPGINSLCRMIRTQQEKNISLRNMPIL